MLHHRWSAERAVLSWNKTALPLKFPCVKERVEPVCVGAELHCIVLAVCILYF